MKTSNQWHCWELMNCEKSEDCPARKKASIPCWEQVEEAGDYRSFCNICRDCIVYVLKSNHSLLTTAQKKSILVKKKSECALAA